MPHTVDYSREKIGHRLDRILVRKARIGISAVGSAMHTLVTIGSSVTKAT